MRGFDRRRVLAAGMMFATCLVGIAVAAPQGDDPAARLRGALRSATLQVRDLQDQNAMLMAKQAEADRDRMALTQKLAADEKELDELREQLKSNQTVSQQAAAQATAQIEMQKTNAAAADTAYRDNLMKWQAAYNEAAETARTRDADAKKLDALLMQTRGRVDVCETKNKELYRIGHEVLDTYDRQDLMSMIKNKESVTKLGRVELETLMQDYEDKLRANDLAHPAPMTQ